MPPVATDPSPSVAPGELHIRYATVGEPFEEASREPLERLLSPAERYRLGRLAHASDRWHYLVAHVLLRRTLSSLAPVAPKAWDFAEDDRGKPEVAAPATARRLRFSLSHTSGLVACAVCLDRDVGVDAEALDARLVAPEVADLFLSRAEREAVARLPEARRLQRLIELWTLKEACLKARGDGLVVAPSAVAFDLAPDRPPVVAFGPGVPGDPSEWWFRVTALASGHVLAAAIRCGRAPVKAFAVRVDGSRFCIT